MFKCKTLLLLVALFLVAESAKRCYSGSKDKYESRQCDTGVDGKFTCQKFTCEGGKSPFVLRTCASKTMGCMAGPAICKFSKGTGSCSRCDNDNLDGNFTVRACSPEGGRCEASEIMCANQSGVGRCEICDDDNCNSTPSKQHHLLPIFVISAVLSTIF